MKASEAIKEIQDAILDAEKSGAKELSIVNLNAYLAGILATAKEQESAESTITEPQAAHQLEVWKARLSAHSAMSTEMLKSTVEAGQTALRSAVVINGGAAATILAFAGNAITKGQLQTGVPLLSQIGSALLWFMVGVGVAGTASGFRYLSQLGHAQFHYSDTNRRWKYLGSFSNSMSIFLGAASFAVFFVGGVAAYKAVVVPPPKQVAVVEKSMGTPATPQPPSGATSTAKQK
ncbi:MULTISPECIES: hypothetical protein [Paraburkholderia]|uniref:hypothetical protein n=1 Tax=Paraburkholderia TaxID=1822464 RepID=UPI00224EA900|nr:MULTISPECIES: hypothetical protein [Paraburkholderia]MCX4156166.1 hypothetical protein [Paraburkholderia aspalathi]MDN7165572.1 hypothetical protein [Paraburkholderia sp. SECH2]MDQ6394058.1 hypothetical protein [Paraburkholderia aspalathi]